MSVGYAIHYYQLIPFDHSRFSLIDCNQSIEFQSKLNLENSNKNECKKDKNKFVSVRSELLVISIYEFNIGEYYFIKLI